MGIYFRLKNTKIKPSVPRRLVLPVRRRGRDEMMSAGLVARILEIGSIPKKVILEMRLVIKEVIK